MRFVLQSYHAPSRIGPTPITPPMISFIADDDGRLDEGVHETFEFFLEGEGKWRVDSRAFIVVQAD